MVCIYCASQTKVINSRPSKRTPGTWRRRECTHCGMVFTTREHADLSDSYMVLTMSKSATSFSRDNLYISLYRSCGHRTTALTDASALTDTVIAKLLINPKEPGLFTTVQIKAICKEILKAFDTTAATYYEAYYR